MNPRALLVEDDESSLEAMERFVQAHGFQTVAVQTLEQARAEIDESPPDIAVLDLDLPDGRGSELVEQLNAGFDTEIIVVTGHGSIDSAVEAVRSGVVDYLTKPVDTDRLERALSGVKRTLGLRRELQELRENLRRLGRFDRLVGSSPPMQEVYDLINRVARTSSTVLVSGETGTGKERIAETIHRLSRRADKRFVGINCGAIQPSLIESELFGHESGSFTGATRSRKGVFEQADGGTLLLDEITEMPLDLQVKLLRVLETRKIQRVGAEKPIDVDVRLIATTNRSPEEAVEEGVFREDLLYRLKVFPIGLPPLRERGADVELLAELFLSELNEDGETSKRLAPATLEKLHTHDWPGNVRELRNVVERAYILASNDVVEPEHLDFDRDSPVRPSSSEGAVTVPIGTSIAEAEKRLIVETLEQLDGDKKKAADILGISLKTLYNRLNRYGMGKKSKAAASRAKSG